jgi:thioredoxin 1
MENFTFECSLEQLIYCPNSDDNLQELEYTNKVILNSDILQKISKKLDKFDSPMIFKVTNITVFGVYNIFVGVHEFTATGNKMYMPNHLMEKIFGQQGSSVSITYYVPPKGSFIKLRPKAENFYQIGDIKKFLENNIQKNYPVLQKDTSILIKHNNLKSGEHEDIELIVTDLKPFEVISTVDTDIEVDFEPITPPKKTKLVNNFLNSDNELDLNNLINDTEHTIPDKNLNITDFITNMGNFNQIISNNNKPIFIQFTANWCGPCKIFGPIFSKLSEYYKDKALFYKIDIDQNSGVSDKYNVSSIPAVLYFNKGENIDNIKNTCEENLDKFFQKNINQFYQKRIQHSVAKINKNYSKTLSSSFVPFSGTGYTLGSK